MSDVNAMLQGLSQAAGVLQQAAAIQGALAGLAVSASQTAQAAVAAVIPAAQSVAASGVSPVALASLAGLAVSHVIEPHTATLSDKLKPVVALGSAFVTAAAPVLVQTGSTQAAAAYGAVAVGAAVASHWAFFKSDGFKSFFTALISAITGGAKPSAQ